MELCSSAVKPIVSGVLNSAAPMSVTAEFIETCESLIAEGRTDAVVGKLLDVKAETAYRPDILNLSSRWQTLTEDEINGTLSSEEEGRKQRRISKDILRLLGAMDREAKGQKPQPGLLDTRRPLPAREFGFKTLVGGILVGSLLAAVGVFLFQYQPEVDCSGRLNLNGAWNISAQVGSTGKRVGTVNIKHDPCTPLFLLGGEVKRNAESGDTDFSARTGGLKDGEIQFIYENFDGERGVCRGIAPAIGGTSFTVHCVDLIGFDKDGSPKTTLVFSRDK